MKIYIICPVRNATPEQLAQQNDYRKKLESEGHSVFYPPRDAPQESKTGYEIVESEAIAIIACDRIDIFWDITSKGEHFDLGMTYMASKILGKKIINIIKLYQPDPAEKSYMKVIKEYNERSNN